MSETKHSAAINAVGDVMRGRANKLSAEQEDKLRGLHRRGVKLKALSQRFGISISTVWHILNRRTA